jgi:O-antigen/teichoic acid export membrane protein
MASRVIRRGTATAAGVWGSALVGFLGTVVAARLLGVDDFGVFAIVVSTAGFVQLLLDLTVEEAIVKYGTRYSAAEDWGRFRRLLRLALGVKLAGGVVGALAILALAPFAESIFGHDGLVAALVVAAFLPVAALPEAVAAAVLVVRGRYDVRGALLTLAMLLRLGALAIGASFGVVEAVAAVVVAQAVTSAVTVFVGLWSLRTVGRGADVPLGDDAAELRAFVLRSSIGSGIVSARGLLAPALLGLVSTVPQVAFFRAAQAPQAGFANLSAPARLVLLSEQTRDFERGRHDRMWAFLERYVAGTAVFAVVAVPVFWWLMPDLVRVVFGDDYAGATDAARLILLAAAIQLVWGWTKSLPVSIGRPGLKILTHGCELLAFVPLVLVLGAEWGATGAAAAVAISTGVFALVWTIVLVRLRREPPPALTGIGAPTAGEVVAP